MILFCGIVIDLCIHMCNVYFSKAPKQPSGAGSLNVVYSIRYGTDDGYYSTVSYYNYSHSEGDQL